MNSWLNVIGDAGILSLWGLPQVACLLGAYVLGSVSFAVVTSRVLGLSDPRTYGSGNPGATNVLRSGHRGAAFLTLLGDVAKGVLAVLVTRAYVRASGGAEVLAVWAGLAAFLGHLYPIFHRFRGGKGVATAAGALLAMSWHLGGLTFLTWLLVVAACRYVSVASMLAAAFAPVYVMELGLGTPMVVPVAVMGLLLIGRHRVNLAKLWAGQESKLGQRASR
jgi:glycerol-3-phosphate acyltransferase PlsY